MRYGVALSAFILAAFGFAPVHAQPDQLSATQHQIQIQGGASLKYTAYAGRVPIRMVGADEAHAEMFFVAYRVPGNGHPRPVTFFWNGGPGAASSTLHLESLGPKHFDKDALVDNPETALAYTDLVYVDAIGTGFSRPSKPEYNKEFYQTRGDILAFTEFVRAWRLLFDAADAPLYVGGESWGAFRAGAVAYNLQKIGINAHGVILLSGQLGLASAITRDDYAPFRIEQQAGIALHHGKLEPSLGKDFAAIQPQIHQWIVEQYIPALARVKSLSETERAAIIDKLALYTGLHRDQINGDTLVVMPRQFLQGLLRDENKTLDTYDMRLPAMSRNVPAAQIVAINRYLRGDLAFRTDLGYITGPGDSSQGYSPNDAPIRSVNAQWDYTIGYYAKEASPEAIRSNNDAAIARGEPPFGQEEPLLEKAMVADPALKVLILNGRDDSLTSCAITQEMLRKEDAALRARITSKCYDGGHMFYRDAATRRQFSADLQAFER